MRRRKLRLRTVTVPTITIHLALTLSFLLYKCEYKVVLVYYALTVIHLSRKLTKFWHKLEAPGDGVAFGIKLRAYPRGHLLMALVLWDSLISAAGFISIPVFPAAARRWLYSFKQLKRFLLKKTPLEEWMILADKKLYFVSGLVLLSRCKFLIYIYFPSVSLWAHNLCGGWLPWWLSVRDAKAAAWCSSDGES